MVVICLPTTAVANVEQERVTIPSMCTLHAPHCPMPHPNFVPVSPKLSRNTQSSGVSSAMLAECLVPLTVSLTSAIWRSGELNC